MNRREALRAGVALGVGTCGLGSLARAVAAHPGPYGPFGSVDIPGTTEAVVSADGRTAYVATMSGYATVDLSVAGSPEVLARRRGLRSTHEDGPLRGVQDVKVEGDTLVVAGPAHAFQSALSGFVVVDVSDPIAPVERGFFETTYPIHNCHLADGRAYLTGNGAAASAEGGEPAAGDAGPTGNPLVVVDVSDPDSPVEVGRWSLLDVDDAWADVPAGLRTLHDVYVQDGVAHCAHWDAGTWLVDVSDPADPVALGSVDAPEPTALADLSGAKRRRAATVPPGNHHYAAVDESGDLLAVGTETWGVRVDDGDGEPDRIVGGPGGVDLWDVSEPASPAHLATIDPPETDDPTFGGTWTTAHNLDLRDGVLYTSWYEGGVKRHDVRDPTAPVEESWWRDPETTFWTAQAAVPGPEGFFVASSAAEQGGRPALYTFPDHAGSNQSTAGGAETTDGNGTDGTPIDRTGATPTGETGATPTGETGATATADDSSGAEAPGFGVGVGVGALGAAAWWLRRRR